MGSFSQTCCLSGLPITAGDDVKYFLLTENPYDDNLVCQPHDMWFPRSLPVRAKYNDYGSIEDYDATSPGVHAIIEGLKLDMVEVGVGDNSCHDVATNKGMSFAETLDAVWEKRIIVQREFDTFEKGRDSKVTDKAKDILGIEKNEPDSSSTEGPEGHPTLQRVSKVITDAGYKVVNGLEGYLVDERDQGWVRVRPGGYGDGQSLDVLLPILQKHYAAMITSGSGRYAHRHEIQVMPSAVDDDYRSSFLDADPKKPLYVFQAMVLQEVWDGIIQAHKKSYKKCRKEIQKEWDDAFSDRDSDELTHLMRSFRRPSSPIGSIIPFSVGLSEHFYAVTDRHAKQPFTEQQISDFLDDIAGFRQLYQVIYPTRYWWRPSFSCGPQFGEFQEHENWLRILVDASVKLKVKHHYEDEYDDYEDDDDVDDQEEK